MHCFVYTGIVLALTCRWSFANEPPLSVEPLVAAAQRGEALWISAALNTGVEVNRRSVEGRLPLVEASRKGVLPIVAALLAAGSDPNARTQWDVIAVVQQAEQGDLAAVNHLKLLGILRTPDQRWREAVLLAASAAGNAGVVEALLKIGAQIEAQDHAGHTALFKAVARRHVAVLDLLLQRGACPDVRDPKTGQQPLHLAASQGRLDVVNRLLNGGASTRGRDHCGQRPRHRAEQAQEHFIVERLKQAGDLSIGERLVRWLSGGGSELPSLDSKGYRPEPPATTFDTLIGVRSLTEDRLAPGDTALLAATSAGHLPVVKALLSAGADVNASNHNEQTALMIAVRAQNVALSTLLVQAGAGVDALDSSDRSALFYAAESGSSALVELLLEQGASPHTCGCAALTPLMVAATQGHVMLVERLMKSHRSHTAPAKALAHAVEHDQLQVVERLLDLGVRPRCGQSVNLEANKSKEKVLVALVLEHLTPFGRHGQALSCEQAVPLKHRFAFGMRIHRGKQRILLPFPSLQEGCLMRAAAYGNLAMVKLLTPYEHDKSQRNPWGETALMVASRQGHEGVVRDLLSAGWLVNDRAGGRWSPIGVRYGAHMVVAQGDTALILAARGGHLRVVEPLLQMGGEVNLTNIYGKTALMAAAEEEHLEVVQRLLAAGASVQCVDNFGESALSLAVRAGTFSVMDALLQVGASPLLLNKAGESALVLAARSGHLEIVKRLLHAAVEQGGQPDLEKALEAAVAQKHTEVVGLLQQWGVES